MRITFRNTGPMRHAFDVSLERPNEKPRALCGAIDHTETDRSSYDVDPICAKCRAIAATRILETADKVSAAIVSDRPFESDVVALETFWYLDGELERTRSI